jgi:hypothetical protein
VPQPAPTTNFPRPGRPLLYFLIFGTFFLDPTGQIRENTKIGLCALRPEGPARFVWRGFAAAAFRG